MSILPTVNVAHIFTDDELTLVDQLITKIGKFYVDDSSNYPDSGKNGKFSNQAISNNIGWDYHNNLEIQSILTPKLEQLLQRQLKVADAHVLESKIPYLLHTDYIHNNQGHNPEYTIIIPLDTYDSITVCFNERSDDYNDFEIYKTNY